MTEMFDDDAYDEDFEAVGTEILEPVEEDPIPVHPLGVFRHEFNGRKVWFHYPSPTQMSALGRLHASTRKKVANLDNENVARLVFDFNNSCLTLVESLILDADDVTFLQDSMLAGEIEVGQILAILWPDSGQDDDADPEPVVKKPKKAARTVSKAVANAQRSKRR